MHDLCVCGHFHPPNNTTELCHICTAGRNVFRISFTDPALGQSHTLMANDEHSKQQWMRSFQSVTSHIIRVGTGTNDKKWGFHDPVSHITCIGTNKRKCKRSHLDMLLVPFSLTHRWGSDSYSEKETWWFRFTDRLHQPSLWGRWCHWFNELVWCACCQCLSFQILQFGKVTAVGLSWVIVYVLLTLTVDFFTQSAAMSESKVPGNIVM